MCAVGFKGPKSKQNSIISFRSKVIVILVISSALGGGAGGWGYLGWTTIVYMSSGVFRGKESSNRCAHARTYTMQMAAPIGGIPGNSLWCHMCAHMHACMCVCVHVCRGHPLNTPHPHPPAPLPHREGTPGISQNSIALELIEIFQFCLKIWYLWRLPHGWGA